MKTINDTTKTEMVSDEETLSNIPPSKPFSARQQYRLIRRAFLEKVSAALFFLALIAYPVSLTRVPEIGFNNVHILHTLLMFVVFVTFFRRKTVSDAWLITSGAGIFSLVSIGGLLQYGIMSGAYMFATAAVFILATTIGLRSAVLFACFFLTCSGIAAWMFINHILTLPVEPAKYFLLPSVWATAGVSFVMAAGVFLIAVYSYLKNTQDLVYTIIKQNRQIRKLANRDYLTGLPSLRLAFDRIEMAVKQATRTSDKMALLFLDLDEFKDVNDSYGHEAGDHVLQTVAKRMLTVVRAGDTVCRVGGDEFMILLSNVHGKEDVEQVCLRLLHIINEEIECNDSLLSVSTSIGVAMFPEHASDAQELKRIADNAMYVAKRAGKNNYCFA